MMRLILAVTVFLSSFGCAFAFDYDFSDEGDFGAYEEQIFVTESGALGSTQDGLEETESSAVDIILLDANRAAIKDLNKGMEGFSSEEKMRYIQDHSKEYKNAGAVSVFAGKNMGEVVVNSNIQYNDQVEYFPLGNAQSGPVTSLQGALLEMTRYPDNANVKEKTFLHLLTG